MEAPKEAEAVVLRRALRRAVCALSTVEKTFWEVKAALAELEALLDEQTEAQ